MLDVPADKERLLVTFQKTLTPVKVSVEAPRDSDLVDDPVETTAPVATEYPAVSKAPEVSVIVLASAIDKASTSVQPPPTPAKVMLAFVVTPAEVRVLPVVVAAKVFVPV